MAWHDSVIGSWVNIWLNQLTGWTAIVASEAVFFTILVDYWGQGFIPQAALCQPHSFTAITF